MSQAVPPVVLKPRFRAVAMRVFLIVAIAIVSLVLLGAVWTDSRHFPHWSESRIEWPRFIDVKLLFGSVIVSLGGLSYCAMIASVTRYASVCIEDGRIVGLLLRLEAPHINIEIDDLFYVLIKRHLNGRISALILIHRGGTDVMKGFTNLEAALEAILKYCPEGIEVSEKGWFQWCDGT